MALSVLSLLTVLTLIPKFAQDVCSSICAMPAFVSSQWLRLAGALLPAAVWACWARGAVLGAGP